MTTAGHKIVTRSENLSGTVHAEARGWAAEGVAPRMGAEATNTSRGVVLAESQGTSSRGVYVLVEGLACETVRGRARGRDDIYK